MSSNSYIPLSNLVWAQLSDVCIGAPLFLLKRDLSGLCIFEMRIYVHLCACEEWVNYSPFAHKSNRDVSTYFVSVLCRVLGNINYSPSRSSGGTKFNLPLGNTSPIIIAVCMHSLPFSRVSNVDFEKRVVSRILVRCIR